MEEKDAATEPATIDGETGMVDPSPPRRIDLSTLGDVRVELATLYRMMDRGKVTTADGSRRAYVLRTIADVIALAELEKRIQELEGRPGLPMQGRALPAERTH